MIIKSATRLAFAAACLTAIGSLTAHAQPADTGGTASGRYWTSQGAYGTPPGAYPAPGTSSAPGTNSPPAAYPAQSQYMPPPPPEQSMGGTQVNTNGPQTSPGDVSSNWSAQRNVAESERYDRLLERNRAFRQARERKECGPITDPQLHQQCLDSFAQYEPSSSTTGYGSSRTTSGSRSSYGR